MRLRHGVAVGRGRSCRLQEVKSCKPKEGAQGWSWGGPLMILGVQGGLGSGWGAGGRGNMGCLRIYGFMGEAGREGEG